MEPSSRSLTHRLWLRGLCALGLVLLLCGLLPAPAAHSQPTTPAGIALYACTSGLCTIPIGSDQSKTVVSFDSKTVSIHGYSLALDGTKLVYALGQAEGAPGTADIYLADADGKNGQKLFSVKGAENGVGDLEGYGVLGLTADNSRIIFEDNAQVFTSKLDGSERRQVLKQFLYGASSSHYYQLSPKRTRLLVTYSDTIPNVSEYNVATGNPYRYELDLSLTPAAMGSDENRILAYRLGRPYNPNAQSRGENMEIPIVGYAEVELPSLKTRPIELSGAIMSTASNGQIVLAQTTQTFGEYKNFQLFDVASGKLTSITIPNFVAFGERAFNNISLVFPVPAVPPPPKLNLTGQVAYVKDGDIWLLDLITQKNSQLTKIGGITPALAWSPDGQQLAFTIKQHDNFDIFSVQADGSNPRALAQSPLDEVSPSYAPDGALLYARATPPDPTNQISGLEVVRQGKDGKDTVIWNPALGGCFAFDLRALTASRFLLGMGCIPDASGVLLVDATTSSKSTGASISDYVSARASAGACAETLIHSDEFAPAHLQPLLAIVGDADCATPGVQGYQQSILIASLSDANAQLMPIPIDIDTIGRPEWSPDDHWLIFNTYGTGGESTGLWVVSAQGGQPQQFSPVGEAPAWRPGSAVDPVAAQKWLDEKDHLIKSLEKVNVDTTLFAFPDLPAYDEKSARALWLRTKTQLQDGTLAPKQLDAFARLTLQERSFSKLLPAYTTVAAAHSTTLVDTLEVGVGTVFALKPAWNICKKAFPFCGRLQSSTEDIVWRVMEDAGITFSTFVGPTHDDREAGARDWKLGLALVQDGFRKRGDAPAAMLEMLRDTTVEASVTGAMIQPYLGRTRTLLAKGIRTADLATTGGDRWPITGTTQRAEVNIDLLNEQLAIEQESALSNYQAFQKGAGILKIAEDVADWATLSPFALIAKAVGIGARLEQIVIVSIPLTYLNLKSLDCIDYLSGRASERAFDADYTFEDCRTRNAPQASNKEALLFVAYHPVFVTPQQDQVAAVADQYRTAMTALIQAIQSKNDQAIEQAIDQFVQADLALGNSLHQSTTIQLANGLQSEQDLQLMQQSQILAARSLAFNLGVTEALIARQEGEKPQNDLGQVAQSVLNQLNELQQAASRANLTPPPGVPLVVLQQVQATVTPDRQLQVNVGVSNIGTVAMPGLKVALHDGDQTLGAPMQTNTLDPGKEAQISFSVPLPETPLISIQVLSGTTVLDTRLQGVPLSELEVEATPSAQAPTAQLVPTSAQSTSASVATSATSSLAAADPAAVATSTSTGQGSFMVIGLIIVALIIGGIIIIRRRARRNPL